ncbi:nuclear transport factor 2 family protein [Pseudoxanthomonas wuyuanensis]
MRLLNLAFRIATAISALAFPVAAAGAQDAARSGPLYDELARMDRELFNAAFVDCDQAKFGSLFTDDAEFYHDRTGASYGENVRKLQNCPRDNGVSRTLIPGSLQVYPIGGYGAVQMGRHTFAREGEQGAEIAQFVHLWNRKDGQWRLSRVLSFDHRPMADQDRRTDPDARP